MYTVNTKTMGTRQTGPLLRKEASKRLWLQWTNSGFNRALDTKLQMCQLKSDLDLVLNEKHLLVMKENQSDTTASATPFHQINISYFSHEFPFQRLSLKYVTRTREWPSKETGAVGIATRLRAGR